MHQNNTKTMRILINLILIAIVAFLVWFLIGSIREPIAFKSEKERRDQAVIGQLMEIREMQELFRNIKGGFAPNWDSLKKVLTTDSFQIVSVIGDPDDPNFDGVITYDTTFLSAGDSIVALGVNLDSLKFVPFGGGTQFDIAADTITYQKTNVPVVEVGVRRNVYMGRYADKRFAKYDQNYDPNSIIKFGSMNAPNLSGNWEN